MPRLGAVLIASLCLCFILLPRQAEAVQVRTATRFNAEPGVISDAAILGNGNLALLYPEAGRIASYSPQGKLGIHIIREAGVSVPFRPTACCIDGDGYLLVFDESERQLFRIASDGNIGTGVNLCYAARPADPPLALARVGGLIPAPSGVWAVLSDKAALARFSRDGTMTEAVDLRSALQLEPLTAVRVQQSKPGSLYLLNYEQGTIHYRGNAYEEFRRIIVPLDKEQDALTPWVQDFAVDDQGRILVATASASRPLMLLLPEKSGYRAHPLKLALPPGEHRIAVRWCAGKYIMWTRDNPIVVVLELH
jgi:hypothetical protein